VTPSGAPKTGYGAELDIAVETKMLTQTAGDAPSQFLRELLGAAVAAADPAKVLPSHLPDPPKGRCVVVGAGKASGAMAAALEKAWPQVPMTGVVSVPYGYAAACDRIRVIEAGHPVPDENSLLAGNLVLEALDDLNPEDLVVALISGGGSATLCRPEEGITFADKQAMNRVLLKSGLDIRTMNAIRQRVSALKGGKLAAAAAPAWVMTFAISDIPGDDVAAIASGPTIPLRTRIDLNPVLAQLAGRLPASVAGLLARPTEASQVPAGPVTLIARPHDALAAAARLAEARGVRAVVLGDDLEGESRELARSLAREIPQIEGPTVLLSGGETTVTIGEGRPGRGGRNTEFALALATELDGRSDIWALAADTDGEDGANLGAAGAIVTPTTLSRARASGLDAADYLRRHDSGSFFEALGDLVVTGATLTNVNDFRAALVLPTG